MEILIILLLCTVGILGTVQMVKELRSPANREFTKMCKEVVEALEQMRWATAEAEASKEFKEKHGYTPIKPPKELIDKHYWRL